MWPSKVLIVSDQNCQLGTLPVELENIRFDKRIVFLNSPADRVEHKNPSDTLSTPGGARTAVMFSNECGISSKSAQHSTKRIIL